MKSDMAKKLTQLRGDKKLVDVAQALGISKSAMSMYERGERTPRDELKVKMAAYYGVSVQELFFSEQNVHTKYKKAAAR